MVRYPVLPESLRSQLAKIAPSEYGRLLCRPCKVIFREGRTLDRVYVGDAARLSIWGVYPEQDPDKSWCPIEDVVSVEASPSRLPAEFANEVYKVGASGMGYCIFAVVFSDGSKQAYVSGNAVDFIEYPEGKGPSNVVGILPHVGRDENPKPAPKYHWCLYAEED
jgi:hypothetical protein